MLFPDGRLYDRYYLDEGGQRQMDSGLECSPVFINIAKATSQKQSREKYLDRVKNTSIKISAALNNSEPDRDELLTLQRFHIYLSILCVFLCIKTP